MQILSHSSLAGFIISIFEFGSNFKTKFFKFCEQDAFAAFTKNSLFLDHSLLQLEYLNQSSITYCADTFFISYQVFFS